MPPAQVAAVDDAPVLHTDEGTELVGEAEPVLLLELPDFHALGGWGRVIVRDPRVEGQALCALDRLGGDPRQ